MTRVIPAILNLLVASSVTALQPWSSNIHEMIVHHRAERSNNDASSLPVPHDVHIEAVTESTIRLSWKLVYVTNPADATSSSAQEATQSQLDQLAADGVKVKVMIYPQADPNDHTYGGPVVTGATADNLLLREYVNLQPGKLYTFIIATTNEYDMCEPVVVNQDTQPEAPTDLVITPFDELKLNLNFLGQQIPHVINTAGVQVDWKEPAQGDADCFDVVIHPDEGHMITPSMDDDEGNHQADIGATVRQFIHLMPGREYTIYVSCTTCGVGQNGPLNSTAIYDSVIIPPMPPTDLDVQSVNHESIEVCWVGPEIGVYNKFKIEWQPTPDGRTEAVHEIYSGSKIVTVPQVEEYNHANKKYCTEIKSTDINPLVPCEAYQIKVSTLMDETKSLSHVMGHVVTKPPAPYAFRVGNFSESFITLNWNGVSAFDGVDILDGIEMCIDNQGKCLKEDFTWVDVGDGNVDKTRSYIDSIKLETLAAGEKHDISLATYCTPRDEHLPASYSKADAVAAGTARIHNGEFKVLSVKQRLTQYTRPNAPSECDSFCESKLGHIDHKWRQLSEEEGAVFPESDLSKPLFDILDTTQTTTRDSMQEKFMYGQGAQTDSGMTVKFDYGYDIRIAETIAVELEWKAPASGYYEGYVITYSPFLNPMDAIATNGSIVVHGLNDLTSLDIGGRNDPPFWQLGTKNKATIYVPFNNQRYTVYIRTVVAGIESKPLIANVMCGAPLKEKRESQCKRASDDFIAPKQEGYAHNEVRLSMPHLVMKNQDGLEPVYYYLEANPSLTTNGVFFQLSSAGDDIVGMRDSQTMIFRNTDAFCAQVACGNAQVFVQICTYGYGCYPKAIFDMCMQKCTGQDAAGGVSYLPYDGDAPTDISRLANVDATTVQGDKCCGTRSYNTDNQVCCHDQLLPKTNEHSNICCGTGFYNRIQQKCCLQGTYHSNPEWTIQLPGKICVAI